MAYAMMHDLPPLRLLHAFAAVVRTGSIQSAAVALNVTQPAVSQAVKQLEARCGVRLLDRTQRPARPTQAGRALADAIAEGFTRIEQTLDAVRHAERESRRSATVACSVGVATYWLMPRLAGFYGAHPELSVNVITTQSGAPDLADGVDLAIRFGHGRWRDGVLSRLFDEVVEPVCSPGLRAQFAGPVALTDVSLLHVKSPEASWLTWADYLRRSGRPEAPGVGQTFTNYVQATQTALDGHGVMLGWRSITGALAAEGRLVSAGLPRIEPDDAYFLVSRPKRDRPAAEAFAAWLLGSTTHGPTTPPAA